MCLRGIEFRYVCQCFFFFKQKPAYEMRISDWSSDVCSSDLAKAGAIGAAQAEAVVDHPVEAGLVVPVAPEQVIIRIADGSVERQRLEKGLVGEDRHRQFELGFLGGAGPRNRILLVGVGDAEDG